MRLIDTNTLELHDFSLSKIPKYAILSHTWGKEEVSFQDMSLPNRSLKNGYAKIKQICHLAREQGLGFAWVDTCCIDKSSSAELTESINSMFQWYKNAAVCYVYLGDLSRDTHVEDGLAHCRWFTRGWTLQELLASQTVEFYDMDWKWRGSKLKLIRAISNITGITPDVLRGQWLLADCSIAVRMSWAAHRQTTRVEDMGYCLLGIFDVNMPLIYGEGLKAFRRLQEEIVKRNSDLTIFAWDLGRSHKKEVLGIFAKSPEAFRESYSIMPFSTDFFNFSVTNKGLLISGDIPLREALVTGDYGCKISQYFVLLGENLDAIDKERGISLRKVGPGIFYRDGNLPLPLFGLSEVGQAHVYHATDFYIIIDPANADIRYFRTFRTGAIHVPLDDTFILEDTVPETLWDLRDRVFLRPRPHPSIPYPMAIAMAFCGTLVRNVFRLVVLCDYRKESPSCKVFRRDEYPRLVAMIFSRSNRNESIYWADLEFEAPEILLLKNCLDLTVGNHFFSISVSFKKGMVKNILSDWLLSLSFDVVQRPDKKPIKTR